MLLPLRTRAIPIPKGGRRRGQFKEGGKRLF